MKKKMMTIWLVVVVFCVSAFTNADITVFDSNAAITEGDVYDTVVVKGDGTVVNMTGGEAEKVIVMDSSTFNMTGGGIGQIIHSYDNSTLNLSDGNIQRITSHGESKVNIFGYVSIAGTVYSYGASVINITSDNVTLSGLCPTKNSTVNITGGTISYIEARGDSNINISGGTIGPVENDDSFFSAKINIIGYGLDAVPYGGIYGHGIITGYWNDNTPVSIDLQDERTYPSLTLFDGIFPPEPLPPLQDQITALQEEIASLQQELAALEQQTTELEQLTAALQQIVNENRDAMVQFTPLQRLLEELALTLQDGTE